MSAKLGQAACLSYTSSKTLITNVRDLKLNMDKNEADVSTRATGGWKATLDGLKDASVEWEAIWDSTDAALAAILSAFLNNTTLIFQIMDGPYGTTGSQGLTGTFTVTKFEREEPLTEGMKVSIQIKPAYGSTPAWYTAP